ncbi:hypothetical protein SAY86_013974 [Trapa natans]|uniref:Uncharacterized protein n=1 Tax=Trapa natans TaxID=22666 RepID=A0AAN7KVI4_TRANT|nr:hypothetical protein SAY86_013974 [Trapa natans]
MAYHSSCSHIHLDIRLVGRTREKHLQETQFTIMGFAQVYRTFWSFMEAELNGHYVQGGNMVGK